MQAAGYTSEKLLKRDVLLVATAGLAALNGLHSSPLFDPMLFFLHRVAPGFLAPMLLFYFNSLLLALATLLLAGVPAALYERVRGLKTSTPVSLGIWLAATFLLSLPGLMGAIGRD